MSPIRRIITLILIAATWLTASAMSIEQVPNVHVADRTRFISDPTGVLSPAAVTLADSIMAHTWQGSSGELVAVIVDDLDGLDVDTYATRLFERWGIGKSDKDNGVLMLVSIADRKAVIRTGYGVEGVLPDVICGRILRNEMFPRFKEGDYDGGVISSLRAIDTILTNPEAADEIMSRYENDADAASDDQDFFTLWIIIGVVCFALMLVCLAVFYFPYTKLERHERYRKLQTLNLPYLVATIAFLGIPILAYLLLRLLMHRIRRSVPKCHNCNHHMRLIDEVHDNDYLTPAQDREEQLDSVDYDVWHCDNCGENEIIPYVNTNRPYTECPNCHARADRAVSNTILVQPTTTHQGVGCKNFHCSNCGFDHSVRYNIAKLASPPVVVGGGRGFGGGGGGFSGGSFGGGMTGGGGASGGW